MLDILRLREQHGECFAVRLPDGQLIPWRALTVAEYVQYERLFHVGVYPRARLENEIFEKCVLDRTLVDEIGTIRAGVVTAVADAVMAHSGPTSLENLNELLNFSRHQASQVVHDLTGMICTAFPAYTPEDLEKLDYMTFMLRVAQAEKKLIQSGLLQQPLSFEPPDGAPQQETVQPPPAPRPEDLPGMWNQQQHPEPVIPKADFSHDGSATVITKAEMIEHQAAYTGHENVDRIVLEKDMVEETAGHYGEYLKQIEDGQQVRIKSVEERKAEAEARAKENEAKYKAFLERKQSEQEELSRLLDKRRAQRAAKRKKR